MTHRSHWMAVAMLLALPLAASADLLVNPGLEDYYIDGYGNPVPTGWGFWQSAWEGWGSPSWINPHIDDGMAYAGQNAWEFGAGDNGASGNGGYSLLIQDVPSATPGVAYTLSAYAADILNGSSTEPALKFEFYRADNSLIWANEVPTPIANDGAYYYVEQTTVAPAETAWLKVICVATEWTGGQSAYLFDEIHLIPEPASLSLLGLGLAALIRRR